MPISDSDRDEMRVIQNLRMEALHNDVSEIKAALRDLTNAITKLALIEERQTQAAASLDRAFAALERMERRIARLEEAAPINGQASRWVFGGMWAAAGALLVMVAKKAGLL